MMLGMEQGESLTIDQLGAIIKNSFEHLEKKIDKLEEKVDQGFARLERVVQGHEFRIASLEGHAGKAA